MTLDNLTIEPPIPALDIGNLILPHLDNILLGVLGVAAVFVAVTAAVFLYHWWRYADNAFLALVTPASYAFGAVILLVVMASII